MICKSCERDRHDECEGLDGSNIAVDNYDLCNCACLHDPPDYANKSLSGQAGQTEREEG